MASLQLNHIPGNHSDNIFNRGLQPVFQSQMFNHGSAFDANLTTAIVPLSSNGNRHDNWVWFRHMNVSLHSTLVLAHRYVAACSVRSGGTVSWVLTAALLWAAILVLFFFVRYRFPPSGASAPQPQRARRETRRTTWDRALGAAEHPRGDARDASRAGSVLFPPRKSRPTDARGLVALPPGPSASALSREVSSLAKETVYLCNLTVVPLGCESILYVPVAPEDSFHVLDQYGDPVIGVELNAGETSEEEWRVKLIAHDGEQVAQCKVAPVPGDGNEFQLFGSNDECFATLVPEGADEVPDMQRFPSEKPPMVWAVRSSCGSKWLFRGRFDNHAVEVTDPQGKVVAMSQSVDGNVYLLRVAPLMDVSIVLCSLLAVHHLR